MIASPNTCSRCRFFTRNACSSRHCYDWRTERPRRGDEADWDDVRKEPRDGPNPED